jgi:hypothetical protein
MICDAIRCCRALLTMNRSSCRSPEKLPVSGIGTLRSATAETISRTISSLLLHRR